MLPLFGSLLLLPFLEVTLVFITPCVFHKYCKDQVGEDPHTTAASSNSRVFELLSHSTEEQRRSVREESGTHVTRVNTFVDLPKEAFTKNTIQDHIFPGNAIMWACTGGESKTVLECRKRLAPLGIRVSASPGT